jgi:hypothetical protein
MRRARTRRAEVPKYRVITVQRCYDEYLVEADSLEEAGLLYYDQEASMHCRQTLDGEVSVHSVELAEDADEAPETPPTYTATHRCGHVVTYYVNPHETRPMVEVLVELSTELCQECVYQATLAAQAPRMLVGRERKKRGKR